MMDLQHILDFLTALRENNHKTWVEAHQADYHQARDTFINIAGFLISRPLRTHFKAFFSSQLSIRGGLSLLGGAFLSTTLSTTPN